MSTRRIKKSNSLFLRIAALIFVGYVVLSMVSIRVDIAKKNRELDDLIAQCEAQKLINRDIERLLALSEDQAYIEKVAREELGYVYPEEIVFIDVSGN